MRREALPWLAAVVWFALVACGFGVWERYEATAGTAGRGEAHATPSGRWQLIFFAHPKCPCTRATLRELEQLIPAIPDCSARVLFVRPAECPDDWEQGESWQAATRISGVEVDYDRDGNEARRFGARTSGHVVLIDPAGTVVFRGGLTRARGRDGESAGRRAVLQWVTAGTGPAESPVYGCGLFTTDE